jgi:hypothetical protein
MTRRPNFWTLRPRAEAQAATVSGLLLDGLRTRDDARQIGILTRSYRGGACLYLAPLLALDSLVMLLFLASGFLESFVNRNWHWPFFLAGDVRAAMVYVLMSLRQALWHPHCGTDARMRRPSIRGNGRTAPAARDRAPTACALPLCAKVRSAGRESVLGCLADAVLGCKARVSHAAAHLPAYALVFSHSARVTAADRMTVRVAWA